jgi:N-acetylmuramoyl-L-alanine amidase
MANKMEADLFISVHNNSSTDGKFRSLNGTMVLYSQKQSADESKRFAQICLENVIESIGSENLGLVKGDDIYIIRSSQVPVALIEVGYMTNVEELEKLCDEEYQKKVAQGIYDAMMQAFEEGF